MSDYAGKCVKMGVVVALVVAQGYAAMEIWAGVGGGGTMDVSEAWKDITWQYHSWNWALSSDSGNTRPGFFGGVDRYPWPIEEVPLEQIRANAPLDENNFPTQVPFTYQGKDYRPVWLFNWFLPLAIYPYGTYTLIAEGKGRIDFGWEKDTTIWLDGGKSVVEFEITSIPETNKIEDNTFNWGQGTKTSGLVMTIVESDPADHIRNIHLIRPDPQGGTSYVDSYEECPITDIWLKAHRLYKTLRFMDWNNANTNGIVHWEDRITPTRFPANDRMMEHAPYMSSEWINANHIPYEFQIKACNTLGCDYWLNVPARADEDYVRNLAQLCKNRLDPNITVYLEWANETWNTMFIGLHSTDFVKNHYNSSVSNLFEAHAYMATRNTKIFREVMGADRVVGVLAGQAASSGVGSNIVSALDNSSINPDNVQMDAYSIAHYFGVQGPNRGWNSAAKSTADSKGLRLLMYEGGTEHGRSPAMYDLIANALTVFDQDGFDNFNAFVAVAGWGDFGDWGFMEYSQQPLEDAHKYRAMYDWAVSHGQFDPNAPVPTCQASGTVVQPERHARGAAATPKPNGTAAHFTLRGQRVPASAVQSKIGVGMLVRETDGVTRRVLIP